jgi:single-strand DNA-binding protein
MNLNKILIIGNLTADPELRYTASGKAVLSASVANNESYTDAQGQDQKITTFVNLEVWGKPAENFSILIDSNSLS